jgi:hypothetical protein
MQAFLGSSWSSPFGHPTSTGVLVRAQALRYQSFQLTLARRAVKNTSAETDDGGLAEGTAKPLVRRSLQVVELIAIEPTTS